MKNAIYRLTLDVQKDNEQAVVRCKQGDTARTIEVTLVDGGQPYAYGSNTYVVMTGKKADGTVLFSSTEVRQDGTIVYEFSRQAAAVAGRILCEIRVYGMDDRVIASARFRILVDGTIVDDETVESADEFSALTEAIANLLAAILDAKTSKKEFDALIADIRQKLANGEFNAKPPLMQIAIETIGYEEEASASAEKIGTAEDGREIWKVNFRLPRGERGLTGLTPQLSVGEVSTGLPGTAPEIYITGTAENPVLNMVIPKGDTGSGNLVIFEEGDV